MSENKRFSICLQNPPYGVTGGDTIHLQFIEKCNQLSEKNIVITSNGLIKRDSKNYKKYKENFNNHLYEIEEIDSKIFDNTNMQNVAIYSFDNTKNYDTLKIKYINNNIEEIKGGILNKDFSGFNEYEKNIVKYLYTDKPNYNQFIYNIKFNLNDVIEKRISSLPDGIYLLTNNTNGSKKGPWNPCFMSSKLGQIFDNKNDLKKCMIERNGARCTIMTFKSIKDAINCKDALLRPLLRFTLLKTQNDQGINTRSYKYVPNIDWSDDRVKTDEGLLEVCGCNKEKAKEYSNYCKEIINKIDKKEKDS